jgi:flagellar biosynthesis chaperone FliJ
MRHRYNYPSMPDLFTGNEYADIDVQLRKVEEELRETREAFEEFARTGDHQDHVRLVEEFMDIDHAVEQGKRLLNRYGASIDQAGREVFERNRNRHRYAPFARMPR